MINNNKIKYRVEIRKENEKFKLLYEGNDNIFNIVDLYQDTNYEIRLCSFDNNIISNWTKKFKVKTKDIIESEILNKSERKKEFINKLIEWTGCESMELLYRGTRDGMTSNEFHNKCINKGKTLCLFLND